MRTLTTLTLASILTASLFAEEVDSLQVTHAPNSPPLAKWQLGALKDTALIGKRVQLPATSANVVRRGGDEEETAGISIVGYVEPVDPGLDAAWQWVRKTDGSDIAASRFTSSGACGLRLRFEDVPSHSDIEIRLANANGDTVYGPFVAPAVDEDGGWWSPTIWDDTVHVELHSQRGLQVDSAEPRVTDIAYLFGGGGCNTTPQAVVPCENDISCFSTWKNNEGRAVALFYNIRQNVCARWSGALLNRGPGDRSPLFMTSRFAVGTQSEAASVEVYWEYETATCNGSVAPNPNNQPRNSGAIRVKGHEDSDWSLLGLKDPPAASSTVYLGWSSADWSSGETAITIHHPRGSHKRISFGDSGISGQAQLCLYSPFFECFVVRHRRVNLDDGRTEIGSTGAPVMDSASRVRLVISGRETDSNIDCSANSERSYGGRFDLAYDNLKYALSDGFIASPVYVNRAVIGDPQNEGAAEQGTSGAPFNTIHEASFIVREGDDLRITPGVYTENIKIYRPMKLVRQGSSGSVRIGN